jgi:hypothetical protein
MLCVLSSLAPRAGDSGLSAATAVRAKRQKRTFTRKRHGAHLGLCRRFLKGIFPLRRRRPEGYISREVFGKTQECGPRRAGMRERSRRAPAYFMPERQWLQPPTAWRPRKYWRPCQCRIRGILLDSPVLASASFSHSPPVLKPFFGKLIPGLLVPLIKLLNIVYSQFLRPSRCHQVFQVLLESVKAVLCLLGSTHRNRQLKNGSTAFTTVVSATKENPKPAQKVRF